MIKAKNLWNYLCNDLDYRFFSGKPCIEFKQLYKTMSPEIMHYIPAANSSTAVGLVSGASVSGHKSAIILDQYDLYDVLGIIDKFNIEYKIPFMLLVYDNGINIKKKLNLPTITLSENYKEELLCIDKQIDKKNIPGIVSFNDVLI